MSARRSSDDLPRDFAQTVLDIAHIAAASGIVTDRAEALLDTLRRLVPFDASFIALLHPDRPAHLPLVRSGYEGSASGFFDDPSWTDDIELLGLRRRQRPMRLCDLPVPAQEVHSWTEYLVPAGFREGLGVGLFTPDGRYLGILGLHSGSPVPPTDAVRDLVGELAPLLAHAVDPLRSIGAVTAVVGDAVAGAVLTHAGMALSLPGLPGHRLLLTGSPVLAVVASGGSAGEGAVQTSFLCTEIADDGVEHHLRVTVLAIPPGPPQHFTAIVMVSAPGDLHRLTPRELEVLGLLVEGWPNQAIAVDLGITERTVAAHVEHVVAKLAVPSRTAAAVRALRLGLFVPRLLHRGALPGDPADG